MAVLVKMYRNVIVKLYNFQDCVFGHKKGDKPFFWQKLSSGVISVKMQ